MKVRISRMVRIVTEMEFTEEFFNQIGLQVTDRAMDINDKVMDYFKSIVENESAVAKFQIGKGCIIEFKFEEDNKL